MSFMGRGDFPSMDNHSDGNIGENDSNNHEYGFFMRSFFWRRFYYYIPLDNTYVIMQMIVTFIILIVGVVTFITSYKSTIIDPIESMKRTFINTHLIILGIFLGATFLIHFLSKNGAMLIKRLVIFAIISIMTMLIFFGIKLNFDSIYTKDKFEQFYLEQNTEEDALKSKLALGLTGLSIKTEKEYYLDECMKLYGIFKTKTYSIIAVHLLLNILLIYQISRVSKLQKKKDRVNEDDAILFDEEQNVKF